MLFHLTLSRSCLQDTEFPGIVARPIGNFKSPSEYHYQTLRCNVDLLKIIQLGLTFTDSEGRLPPGIATWQFNFRFSLTYAQASSLFIPISFAYGATLHIVISSANSHM
jgi:hypothetical protein